MDPERTIKDMMLAFAEENWATFRELEDAYNEWRAIKNGFEPKIDGDIIHGFLLKLAMRKGIKF